MIRGQCQRSEVLTSQVHPADAVSDLSETCHAQVVIGNPILNSPFEEPTRHFRFSDDAITDKIVESGRVSSYFMPRPGSA